MVRPRDDLLASKRQGLRRKDAPGAFPYVDRLGRNCAHVWDTIREIMRRDVVVRTTMNGLTFDGVTQDRVQQAVRDALMHS